MLHEHENKNFPPIQPEPEIERVTVLNEHNAVRAALEDLQEQPRSPELANPAVAILTTNEQVVDRQLRLVDERDNTEEPFFKVYAKLSNWVEARASLPEGTYRDEPFRFAGMKSDSLLTGGGASFMARTAQLEATKVSFIYGENFRTTDGLVELTIPADSENVASDIGNALRTLTGDGLWNEQGAGDSLRTWKADTYRRYHKLPEGPLTAEQAAEAEQLHIEQVTTDRIALTRPGQHEAYHLDYAPEQLIMPDHEFKRLGNALETIRSGALLPSLGRLERGESTLGRSSGADMMHGGGDVVFTYAHAADHTLYTAEAIMRLKPSVLDRLDVRAYNDDAYASTESADLSKIDQAMGRSPSRIRNVAGYDDRLAPEDFHTLGGVHELCFEGGVAISECQELLLNDKEDSSFQDFDWVQQLSGYAKPDAYGGITWAADQLANIWGDEEKVRAMLTHFGLPPQRVEYLTVGMNLPPVERALAKLEQAGITEINGRPAREFIKPVPTYKPRHS